MDTDKEDSLEGIFVGWMKISRFCKPTAREGHHFSEKWGYKLEADSGALRGP
ncbi:hypothetical protein [Paenibacillus sp. OAS669]|uniref:hypothetical protein n=1 Tax=Paenibacillus sp. OAS669 TaxID=2663821 RepID=UPI00178A9E87|nr:hypothetical protein [Paenibacillus sp. OAS669]MBE1442204.1 hypothetical protein [Paenibacillus sp. OAS669]